MGGKTWSRAEEQLFWQVIVPRSPKGVNPAGRISDWEECSKIMQRTMGENARRDYTKLMLFEHYFQNVQTGHKSPHAREFVVVHKRELGGFPTAHGHAVNINRRQAGKGKTSRSGSTSADSEKTSGSATSVDSTASSKSVFDAQAEPPHSNSSRSWNQQGSTAVGQVDISGTQDYELCGQAIPTEPAQPAGVSLKRRAEPISPELMPASKVSRLTVQQAPDRSALQESFERPEPRAPIALFRSPYRRLYKSAPAFFGPGDSISGPFGSWGAPIEGPFSQTPRNAVPELPARAVREREGGLQERQPTRQSDAEQTVDA